MTVMAAELGYGAVESEGAESVAAAKQATAPPKRTGGRTQQGTARQRTATRIVRAAPQGRAASAVVKRTGGRTQQGTSGSRRVSTAAPKPPPRPPASRGFRGQQAAARGAKQLTGNYHGAIFVEYVLAVVLVAGLPFAKPNQTGVSPYAGSDMIKLLALTALYFLLALGAATGRTQARFAAWFGALILLGIGLSEGNAITTAVRTWLPGGTTSTTSTASSAAGTTTQTTGNASVVNAPSTETATGISRAVAQAPGNGLS